MNKPKISNEEELMLALIEAGIHLTNNQWNFVRIVNDVARETNIQIKDLKINFANLNPDFFYHHVYNLVVMMHNNNTLPKDEELETILQNSNYQSK
jgi:hypothetical protein